MVVKNRILFRYSLVSIITTVIVALVMGFFINKIAVNYLILSHVELYPYIINHLVEEEHELHRLFDTGDISFFEPKRLFFRPFIFRVKLWDSEHRVVWSDRAELIGRRFPENDELARALKGEISYEVGRSYREENATENGYGVFFEYYIPAYYKGKIIGVVEIYEQGGELAATIKLSRLRIWSIIVGSFLVYYLVLFIHFYNSSRQLNRIVRKLYQTQDVTIFGLAYQAELRDNETGYHLARTAKYVELIAMELQKDERFKQKISRDYIHSLVKSAPLHDIGKVGIPDRVLLKEGKLTEREFEEIKLHAEYGVRTLKALERKLPFQSFLAIAIELAECHHEKWNGQGYPKGLKGDDIPLSGLIMAIADVYDALRTARCYKDSIPHEQCVEIIKAERGEHFAPFIVDTFLAVHEEFKKISIELSDPE